MGRCCNKWDNFSRRTNIHASFWNKPFKDRLHNRVYRCSTRLLFSSKRYYINSLIRTTVWLLHKCRYSNKHGEHKFFLHCLKYVGFSVTKSEILILIRILNPKNDLICVLNLNSNRRCYVQKECDDCRSLKYYSFEYMFVFLASRSQVEYISL